MLWDSNSGPRRCRASTPLVEPNPQPQKAAILENITRSHQRAFGGPHAALDSKPHQAQTPPRRRNPSDSLPPEPVPQLSFLVSDFLDRTKPPGLPSPRGPSSCHCSLQQPTRGGGRAVQRVCAGGSLGLCGSQICILTVATTSPLTNGRGRGEERKGETENRKEDGLQGRLGSRV